MWTATKQNDRARYLGVLKEETSDLNPEDAKTKEAIALDFQHKVANVWYDIIEAAAMSAAEAEHNMYIQAMDMHFPSGSPVCTVYEAAELWRTNKNPSPWDCLDFFSMKYGTKVFEKEGKLYYKPGAFTDEAADRFEKKQLCELLGENGTYTDQGVSLKGTRLRGTKAGHQGPTSGGCLKRIFTRTENAIEKRMDPPEESKSKKSQNPFTVRTNKPSSTKLELCQKVFESSWLVTPGNEVQFEEQPRAEPKRLKDGSVELDFGFIIRRGGCPISWTRGESHKSVSEHFAQWKHKFKHWGSFTFYDPSIDEIETTPDKEPSQDAPDSSPRKKGSSQGSRQTDIKLLQHKLQEMEESLLKLKREKKEAEKQHKNEINKLIQQHKKELEKAATAYAEDNAEGEEAIEKKVKEMVNSRSKRPAIKNVSGV